MTFQCPSTNIPILTWVAFISPTVHRQSFQTDDHFLTSLQEKKS